jgi:hypothetical protein
MIKEMKVKIRSTESISKEFWGKEGTVVNSRADICYGSLYLVIFDPPIETSGGVLTREMWLPWNALN